MKKVLILMATYNGAKYLDEQIQSLIEQKCTSRYLSQR